MGLGDGEGERRGAATARGSRLKKLREYAAYYTDPYSRTCERCREEELVHGIVPDCSDCERPRLAPGNLLAWEIYRTLASQFSQDFAVDVFQVLDLYHVSNRRRLLAKLALIHTIACENAEERKPPDGQ